MFMYTSIRHHYVTHHSKYNTVHVNVFLWLHLDVWKNWKIKTINKENSQIFGKNGNTTKQFISYLWSS